jgi:hypothetical protein
MFTMFRSNPKKIRVSTVVPVVLVHPRPDLCTLQCIWQLKLQCYGRGLYGINFTVLIEFDCASGNES